MTDALRAKFQEVAKLIYEDDEIAVECAMEHLEEDGDLFICFDNFSEFEDKKPTVEEACWARGLVLEPEGGGYVVKVDKNEGR